jgi:hypothetical protein
VAAPETAADHVAHGVLPPAFRVPSRQHRCLTPTRRPGLLVEGPRALLPCRRSRRSPATPLAVVLPTGRGRATHPTQPSSNLRESTVRNRFALNVTMQPRQQDSIPYIHSSRNRFP